MSFALFAADGAAQTIDAPRCGAGVHESEALGGERIFRREPATLPSKLFHGGAELRTGRAGPVRLVSGVDLKATDLHDWSSAVSGRVGLEVAQHRSEGHPARLVTLMIEIYRGPSPYGQFFQDDISYFGVVLHFGL